MTGQRNSTGQCSSAGTINGKLCRHDQRALNQDKRTSSSLSPRAGSNGLRSISTGRFSSRPVNLSSSTNRIVYSEASSSTASRRTSLLSRRTMHSSDKTVSVSVESGKMDLDDDCTPETSSSRSQGTVLDINKNKKPEHIQPRSSPARNAVVGGSKAASQSNWQLAQSRRSTPTSRALIGNSNVSNQSKPSSGSTSTAMSKRTIRPLSQTSRLVPGNSDNPTSSGHRLCRTNVSHTSSGSSSVTCNVPQAAQCPSDRNETSLSSLPSNETETNHDNINGDSRADRDQIANSSRTDPEHQRHLRPTHAQESRSLDNNRHSSLSSRQSPMSTGRERGSHVTTSRHRVDPGAHSSPVSSRTGLVGETSRSLNNLSTGSTQRSSLRNRSRLRSPASMTDSNQGRATSHINLSTPPQRNPPSLFPPPTRSPPLVPRRSTSNIIEHAFPLPSPVTSPLPSGIHSPEFDLLVNDDNNRMNPLLGNSSIYSSRILQQAQLTVQGLSEVLSSLEQTERNENSIYEQILMLEATILFGGLGLPDRHSDMRLDVDNMSYEELLALEERIGDVNVGLSEEAIKECIKRKKFVQCAMSVADIQDIKCSICQEEFEDGVEVGVLVCGHYHHPACIKQWLCRKNQCPICKASAR